MSEPKLTKEMVFAVADRLDQLGQNPTLSAIRKELGRGSFTTISDFMADWKNNRKKGQTEAQTREPAPQEVMDRLAELGTEVWSLALATSTEKFNEEREKFEANMDEYEERLEEINQAADQLVFENEQLRTENNSIAETLTAEREERRVVEQELVSHQGRVATAEARVEELYQRINDLTHQSAQSHEIWKEERHRHNALVEDHQKQAVEVSRLQNELQQFKKLEERAQRLEQERDLSRQEASTKAIEAGQLRGEIEPLRKQVEQLTKLIDSMTDATKS